MIISSSDRIAALETACRAEQECLQRAKRTGNSTAVAINKRRLAAAEERLEAARQSLCTAPSSTPEQVQ